jgi:hypothetical protein
MNWYKRAQSESFGLKELLEWMSEPQVKMAQIGIKGRGHTRNPLTENQENIIKEMYTKGMGQSVIAREIGVSPAVVRGYLIRKRLINPGVGSTGGGLSGDPYVIKKVKKLRRTINPNTGKFYNKSEISRELDVSTQVVDRTIAFHDIQTPKDLASYVSYKFWGRYTGGIKNTLKDIPKKDRYKFVTDFIDTLFKNPKDRASAKEAIFQKIKMRNEMVEGPDADPPATQLVESPYNPDFATEGPSPLIPQVADPVNSGIWKRRQQQRQNQPPKQPQRMTDRYDPARIDMILTEYAQGGYRGYTNLARKHGMSFKSLRAILLENNMPVGKEQRESPKPLGSNMPVGREQRKSPKPLTYRQQVKKLWNWYDQQETLGERSTRDLEAEHREKLRLLREQREQSRQQPQQQEAVYALHRIIKKHAS